MTAKLSTVERRERAIARKRAKYNALPKEKRDLVDASDPEKVCDINRGGCGQKLDIFAFNWNWRFNKGGSVGFSIDPICSTCEYKKKRIVEPGETLVATGKPRIVNHSGPPKGSVEYSFFCKLCPNSGSENRYEAM